MNQPSNSREEMKKERYAMKRERDVLLLYGAAFRDIPHTDNVEHHVPRQSPDSTLSALCQLTAIRLGAQRAMISLLDDRRQHILAEATCEMSLRPEAPGDASSTLWLGNVSIPRNWGLCETILEMEPLDDPVLIIDDLAQDGRTCYRDDVQNNPAMRFYASAALLSPNDAIVGTLCVFADQPRDGLSKGELSLLKDLATTVVDYLNTYTIKDQYRRGERFTRGLVSFAEGASALVPFGNSNRRGSMSTYSQPHLDLSSATEKEAASTEDFKDTSSAQDTTDSNNAKETPGTDDAKDMRDANPLVQKSPSRQPSISSRSNRAKSARHRSIRTLQDSILPTDTKSMFSRAANVMMASSDLDGVLILDASVAANGGQRRTGSVSGSGAEHLSESYNSRSSSSDEQDSNDTGTSRRGMSLSTSKMCQVLGVSVPGNGENAEYGTLLEPDLARLFHEYPLGKIFTYTAGGLSLSSTEESSSRSNASVPEELPSETTPKRKTNGRALRGSKALQAMFTGARSVAFIPFWDYERSRWFAGCLCWSNNPYRLLSASVDLAYFKIFSHSMMRELSKLDAMAIDHAKTTFVASISHELRSPLHGILGTLEFIKDTPLDSFQTSMLNSLHACGTTLLDTINHVMDYAKISEPTKSVSSRRLKNANTIRLSSKPLKSRRIKDSAFDLALVTEEVVEAVFSGSSYIPVSSKLMEAPQTPSDEGSIDFPKRKVCFIILDLNLEEDWMYLFPVGSWRRIVMNLFGNAVKYTGSGYIHIALRASSLAQNSGAPTAITLTITDSGSGMSPAFLANKAFQPFSQEDSHAPGTGLGLSIVRQIIDTSGGKIEITSEPSVGTKLTVKLALAKPETLNVTSSAREQFLYFLPRLEGRRLCILHKEVALSSGDSTTSRTDEGLLRFTNTLATTLEKHLKMIVIQTTSLEGHDADIVICPELSFDYLATIRRRRVDAQKAPVTVFVAMDALEAAVLRSDVRVTNKESVVEIMTQPCGPNKLAFVLNQCLDRFERPSENLGGTRPVTPPSQQDSFQHAERPKYASSFTSIRTDSLDVEPPTPPSSSVTRSVDGSTVPELPITLSTEEDTDVPHILITDDNYLNRRLLVAFMRKHGLLYQEATNGLEALQAYQQGSRKFAVILMDMSMPVMDGMSATRAIREYETNHKKPRCSIIALTGLASSSAKLEAWNSGIDHFMTKPVNFKALGELLRDDDNRRQRKASEAGRSKVTHDSKAAADVKAASVMYAQDDPVP